MGTKNNGRSLERWNGEAFKREIKKAGETPTGVARKLKILVNNKNKDENKYQSLIYCYIAGTEGVGINRLGEIAEILGVVPAALLTPEDPLTLRGWRENYAVTQKQLSDNISLSYSLISRKEREDVFIADLDEEIKKEIVVFQKQREIFYTLK